MSGIQPRYTGPKKFKKKWGPNTGLRSPSFQETRSKLTETLPFIDRLKFLRRGPVARLLRRAFNAGPAKPPPLERGKNYTVEVK